MGLLHFHSAAMARHRSDALQSIRIRNIINRHIRIFRNHFDAGTKILENNPTCAFSRLFATLALMMLAIR
jgi:hypothetical protein